MDQIGRVSALTVLSEGAQEAQLLKVFYRTLHVAQGRAMRRGSVDPGRRSEPDAARKLRLEVNHAVDAKIEEAQVALNGVVLDIPQHNESSVLLTHERTPKSGISAPCASCFPVGRGFRCGLKSRANG